MVGLPGERGGGDSPPPENGGGMLTARILAQSFSFCTWRTDACSFSRAPGGGALRGGARWEGPGNPEELGGAGEGKGGARPG